MRLFTGIAIDRDVMERLEQVLRELRPLAPLNWSPLENLHITTKFIGAWPGERLEELTHALAERQPPAAFPVTIAGLLLKPRVLFAGVHSGPELATLARQVEESLEPLGVAREQRAYMPHITLARIGDKPVHAVREHIANMKTPEFGTFQVAEFHLYSSRPRTGGSGSVHTLRRAHRLKPVPPSAQTHGLENVEAPGTGQGPRGSGSVYEILTTFPLGSRA